MAIIRTISTAAQNTITPITGDAEAHRIVEAAHIGGVSPRFLDIIAEAVTKAELVHTANLEALNVSAIQALSAAPSAINIGRTTTDESPATTRGA